MKIFFIEINQKKYCCRLENYLIVDYINEKIGNCITFKKVKLIFISENKIYKTNLNALILKHLKFKYYVIKKKRRKNFIKKIINYKRKTLLFIQNFF